MGGAPGSEGAPTVPTPGWSSATHQLFGHYTGTVRTDKGESVGVDGLLGFAEHVHMRW
ncbi:MULTISPECIES: DUF2804 family protein [Nocardiopsis]|uniref:DUF2804 family protein n=1 Tax=Nocardiopsis TaxID=2013 RepID=UPI000988A8E4|nr:MULTISPECIES: DUF2804 family protein [Nocardiopsis]